MAELPFQVKESNNKIKKGIGMAPSQTSNQHKTSKSGTLKVHQVLKDVAKEGS